MKFIKPSAIALVLGLALWFLSFSLASRLPAPRENPELRNEPEQTATTAQPFQRQLQGHTYSITPVFDYRLKGRVVSLSDAMGFTNITHKANGDFLNTHDFCLAWGDNVEKVDLREFSITHGDWTCYYSTRNGTEYRKFKPEAVSNNHVLPDTPEIAAQFRDVRIGDEVEISGQLVNYSIDGRGSRNSSTIRTDTGNGACEVIYVKEFRFLHRHNELLYKLASLGRALTLVALVALLASLFVLPFTKIARD